jgi:hypothetical protein
MKFCFRRAAAVALAVALSLPTVAMALPQERERSRDRSEIVRIIKKIQRLLGISTNDDLPLPPFPKP